MSARTKARCLGAVILLFNLWLIGSLGLSGPVVLLMTVGFVVLYEGFVVRQIQSPKDS